VDRLNMGWTSAGRYEQRFDMSRFASGLYLYELRVTNQKSMLFRGTGKMILIK